VEILESTDRGDLAAYFRRMESAHAYGLADLDVPVWPSVRAFVARQGGATCAAALLLDTLGVPLLYAVAPPGDEATIALLKAIAGELPLPCGATIALGAIESLGWHFDSAGEFLKMRLAADANPVDDESVSVQPLDLDDYEEVSRFYEEAAYAPGEGGFFRRFMLELGPYFGVREGGKLVAAGGVHVRSERYGVAALGNIATTPYRRGQGLAGVIVRALCRNLSSQVPLIALNVRHDNIAAVRCYERSGFRPVLRYEEGWIREV
jgi:RimJ/RimL family protein N-acetyltransferase